MSKKAKKAKLAKKKQRITLQPYLGETVQASGTIVGFSNTIINQIQGPKKNILILKNVKIKDLTFEKLFIILNNKSIKKNIGDQITIRATVNRYESIRRNPSQWGITAYRYGLIIND